MRRDELVAGESYAYARSQHGTTKKLVVGSTAKVTANTGRRGRTISGVEATFFKSDSNEVDHTAVVEPRYIMHTWEVEEQLAAEWAARRDAEDAWRARSMAAKEELRALGVYADVNSIGRALTIGTTDVEALLARLGVTR